MGCLHGLEVIYFLQHMHTYIIYQFYLTKQRVLHFSVIGHLNVTGIIPR